MPQISLLATVVAPVAGFVFGAATNAVRFTLIGLSFALLG